MKRQIIRLTESDLHRIIEDTVNRIISEDGEGIGGGGATNTAGAMQGGGNNPNAGTYDVPFGGKKVIHRKGYSPKGDKVSQGMTQVDMSDATARHDGKGGSISIPKRTR